MIERMGKRRRRSSRDSFWTQQYGGMPVWGLALAAVALLAAAAIAVPAALSQPARSEASTLRPLPTMAQPEVKPRVVFIGDSYTGGSEEDSGASSRWPELVADELDVRSTVLAQGGSGYVTTGPSGVPITDEAAEIPADASVVVVFGSRNDFAQDGSVGAAADAMYSEIEARAPSARVLIVGPAWVDSNPPSTILNSNEELREAAAIHGFQFVAATDAGILMDEPKLIGRDGVHPNDAGHVALADFMKPLIEPLLPST